MGKRGIGFRARHRSEDDLGPLATSPTVGSIVALSDSPVELEADPEPSSGPYEVRFTAMSVNGATVHQSIERHEGVETVAERAGEILGRLGYDGNLRSLAIVIEIPAEEALKASIEFASKALGDLRARNLKS